jgi:2,3-bisphosphoglycerate-dependent phosphoglycerate mutase
MMFYHRLDNNRSFATTGTLFRSVVHIPNNHNHNHNNHNQKPTTTTTKTTLHISLLVQQQQQQQQQQQGFARCFFSLFYRRYSGAAIVCRVRFFEKEKMSLLATCTSSSSSNGTLSRWTISHARRLLLVNCPRDQPPPPPPPHYQQHYHHHQRYHQHQQRLSVSTLILLRHGQSQWNGTKARFTGWCDVPLTVRGRVEAVAAGQLMRSRGFKASRVCVAFASELQRSHETCELALASMAGHEQHTWSSERIRRDVRLNERHYGAVQGKYKDDMELQERYGEEQIRYWRRSLHGKAPPMDVHHEYYLPSPPAPLTESLWDCQQRVLDCWEDAIAPAMFDEEGLPMPPDERCIIVVAHANTIRSLVAHFDEVPEDLVSKIYVPNSVPILYRFDRTKSKRRPISLKLESAHGQSHARWMLSSENHGAVRDAIQKGGTLTRALFDAIGTLDYTAPTRFEITGAQLEQGVRELMKDSAVMDCVVMGVAKQIARELASTDVIHIKEFERRTKEAYESLTFKHLNDEDIVSETKYGSY